MTDFVKRMTHTYLLFVLLVIPIDPHTRTTRSTAFTTPNRQGGCPRWLESEGGKAEGGGHSWPFVRKVSSYLALPRKFGGVV